MTFWATEARLQEVERGEFFCPHCDRQRRYRYYHVPTFFTLLSVPLYQNGLVADYIECSRCKRQFAPASVDRKPPQTQLFKAKAA